jgi:peptidoglycan/xylan/chitin deacetylase (PgdA/CDA1 family)
MPSEPTKSLRPGALTALALLIIGCSADAGRTADEARPSPPRPSTAQVDTKPVERRLRLPARLPRRQLSVPILMYHRINYASSSEPEITRRLTVHPTDFARQMRWLKRHGYRTVTQRQLFAALMHGRPLGRKPIMITFDDGYRDAYYKAAPVLSKLGMRATAYVISGRVVNGDRTFLSLGLLRRLERLGVEIGSHSMSHRDLTQLSDRELPFGCYDARVERLARSAGYVLAVTTELGAYQSASRPLRLRRLRVLDSTGVPGLASLLGSSVS